jgi:HPt (histidine-containing phosphotransfer) domain-containing protein
VSHPDAGTDVVDAVRAQLAELCGSDDEQDWAMLGDVLDAFVEGSAERLDELVHAIADGSVPEVEFLSHRLKGSALTLGATALAHVCDRLEADARENLVDGSGQLVRALVRELEAAVSAVEHVRAALPADTSVPVASNGW